MRASKGAARALLIALAAFVVTVWAVPIAAAGDIPDEPQPGRVAYSWGGEIYVMTPDGGNRQRLTYDGGIFIRGVPDEDGVLWDLNTGSGSPVWMPGGNQLAYEYFNQQERTELRSIDPDGGNMRILHWDWRATAPSWSPDGQRIAYADDTGVWVADADFSSPILIAAASTGQWPNAPGYQSWPYAVEWSPNSDHIVFLEWSGEGLVAGLEYASIVNADGSNRVRDVCAGSNLTVDWKPDGSQFTCSYSPVSEPVISFHDPDGTKTDALRGTGYAAAWSPDGSQIIFVDEASDLWQWQHSTDLTSMLAEDLQIFWYRGRMHWQPRAGSFWDDDSSVFVADIEWMADEGVTKGCNPPVNDKYCPGATVTRGQMAAFLVRALDLPAAASAGFTDTVGTTFEQDIDRLAAARITKGCNPPDNDRFCPDDKVRREVMAAFLVRALKYTDDGGGDLFTDDDSSIFEPDIDKLATAGVTKGCNPPVNDRFCPTQNVTRGQMAAFLHRALS